MQLKLLATFGFLIVVVKGLNGPSKSKSPLAMGGTVPSAKTCSLSIPKAGSDSTGNEDRTLDKKFIINGERWHIHGVFDGHAGQSISQYLSDNIADELSLTMERVFGDIHDREFMRRLIEEVVYGIDRHICTSGDPKFQQGGSTASFVLRNSKLAYLVNVGDSSTLVVRNSEVIIHRSTQYPVAAGTPEYARILRANGYLKNSYINGLFAGSRAFGDCTCKRAGVKGKPRSKVQYTPEMYTGRDGILVATPDIDVVELESLKSYRFISVTDGFDIDDLDISLKAISYPFDSQTCVAFFNEATATFNILRDDTTVVISDKDNR